MMDGSDTNTWVEIIEIIGIVAVALIAILRELFSGKLLRPALRMSVQPDPPTCTLLLHYQPTTQDIIPVYHVRLQVTNQSKYRATNVRMRLLRIEQKYVDGTYKELSHLSRVRLQWARGGKLLWAVGPGGSEHCDLHIYRFSDAVSIAKDSLWPEMDTIGNIPRVDSLLAFATSSPIPPLTIGIGAFRISLIASASNMRRALYHIMEVALDSHRFDSRCGICTDGASVQAQRVPR